MAPIRLNIGAGDTNLEGWTPIDRKFGSEAYPLDYADDSVDEIRASHILEHFSFAEANRALADWVRVLKPGGRIRIAVPDVDKCLSSRSDPNRLFYLMGGQTDSNDFHKSAYDADRLTAMLQGCGLVDVQPWESANTDCASLPISLNLEGIKPTAQQVKEIRVKIGACMTLPRYIPAAPRGIIEKAFKPLEINLNTSQGVFYGQCMQRMMEEYVGQGADWIFTVDMDSMITSEDISALMDVFARHPEIDALAPLQCRRGRPFPLLTVGHDHEVACDGTPIKVTTAHFGLTLIRVDALKDVPKPWFKSEPDEKGEWGDERLDDDIWFWHQWRLAGKNIYVTPQVKIGHMEEMVSVYDDDLQPQFIYMTEWRKQNLGDLECQTDLCPSSSSEPGGDAK